ncbi:zinc ribbon domain-containing protein [Pseudomonas aeruginosa]
MTTAAPAVLYVYHCTLCGHDGQLHREETAPEVTTACSVCGAEVLAEWDGGVTLAINQPE